MSSFLRLNYKDLVNGVIIAVIAAVAGAVDLNTFNLFAANWQEIGKIALSAAVVYLLKKFLTMENGKIFGRIG